MSRFLTVALCGLISPVARADLMFGPEVFVKQSIEAHGGEKNIDKYRAESLKLEGKLIHDGREVAFTGEFLIQLPGQYKNVIRFEEGGVKNEIVTVFNTDKGWRRTNSKTEDLSAREVAQAKDTMHVHKVARMTVIPNDRDYKLTNLNQGLAASMIDGVSAWGIKVSAKGEKDVTLWIADKSKLLVRLERSVAGADGKPMKIELAYGDYKEISGVRRPTRHTIWMDGQKTTEGKATEIKLLEQIDEKEFAKP